jgi:DNA helicase-2/ATP-dependent DNA helicase PcrA
MNLLENLNKEQKEAVLHLDGPVLVIAGAGSGKTRVLSHRVAYLIKEKKVEPYNILAVTFTNKAAREMRERIVSLLGFDSPALWISTFHSSCVRILRREIEKLNLTSNFVIFDTSEQKTLIRETMKELNINEKLLPYQVVMSKISKAKNDLVTPENYANHFSPQFSDRISDIYSMYQKKLKQNNALDFDDLIFFVVRLFEKCPEVLEKYQRLFHYILIDEYQDINNAQYRLIKNLAAKRRNLFVVGDEDQSIYAFRGANMDIILNFEQDFHEAHVIKLQQNYRSTGSILGAANELVKRNQRRRHKELWTRKDDGKKPFCQEAVDERDEALFVIDKIKELSGKEHRKLSDFVILYRTNAQSRVFEEALMAEGLPYQIVGGLKFYDRKEIKDILAYVRLLWNPSDSISLKRIINVPARGIGDKTLEKLDEFALETNRNVFEVLKDIDLLKERKIPPKALNAISDFMDFMGNLHKIMEEESISRLIEEVMKQSGYIKSLHDQNSVEAITRIENLEELLKVAQEFEYNYPGSGIDEFLSTTSLASDVDMMEDAKESITLMTVHSAKGLEYPVVFVTGLEEGIFPHARSINTGSDKDIEEERRLAYVALTRAMEDLYLSHAWRRTVYGTGAEYNEPSRFLGDIVDYVERKVEDKDLFVSKPSKREFFDVKTVNPEVITKNQKGSSKLTYYRKGDIVKHKEFGKGNVMNIIGQAGPEQILLVSFQTVGLKKVEAKSLLGK